MTRRPLVSLLVLLASAVTLAAAQQPAPGAPPQGDAAQGQGRPQQDTGPKPYRQVITSLATTDSGVFIIHRLGEKLFYEIPRTLFGREFVLVGAQRGTIRGVRYAGEEVTDRIVRWERLGNRVLLRLVQYDMRADTTLPVARAVNLSNQAPIVLSFDVAAWSPDDSNAVIEVTRLYTTDVGELNIRQSGVRVRRLDPARSVIERAVSFPRNIEVSALQTFEVDSVPGPAGQPYDRSLNSLTMLMNYSMLLLPDQPMQPRLCDSRVGFFAERFEDFGLDRPRVPNRCYIARWRLESSNPAAAVSDPVKPIVFYIDPATPEKWVPWLIRGVQAWEPVFRAAGFSNAIQARRAPTPQEDPEFDLDDARYSSIRWLPSTIENAYGPHLSDPRTGEILKTSIGWYQNITSLLQDWYWVQVGAVDPRAAHLPFPDSLMGQMVAYVATHEVGHTLGLPHNQLSSGYYPVDSLRSASYTRVNGTSYSIMDYARNNYVAQPGDNTNLMPHIGPWDYYAINWGYRRYPGVSNPEAERPILDSLARLQDAHPEFRFGNPDGVDPRTQTEALGDDPVRATRFGLMNIKRLVPMLVEATTTDRMDDYASLDDMYGRLIAQWGLEMNHVAVVVGGVYRHEKYPDQEGVIHTVVPRVRQSEAVRFLIDNAFTTPAYFLDTNVLRRIEPSGSVDRIRTRQGALLNAMLTDARLARLAEQTAMPGSGNYGIGDLLGDLRRGIFSEAAAVRPSTDGYRRNVQRGFVDAMDRLINTPLLFVPPNLPPQFAATIVARPADARALARAELNALAAQLRTALLRTSDRDTRAHFEDLRARIDRILNPLPAAGR